MNRIKRNHSILSLVLLFALIAAIALSLVACDNKDVADTSAETTAENTTAEAVTSDDTEAPAEPSATEVGEGQTEFTFNVKFADGTTRSYLVKTDKTTVGAALLDAELIEGDNSEYGLYVKKVCGEEHDYNTDGSYWSFYINGEYAMTGVDSTAVTAGEVYSFEAAK